MRIVIHRSMSISLACKGYNLQPQRTWCWWRGVQRNPQTGPPEWGVKKKHSLLGAALFRLYAVRYARHKASMASPNDTTDIPPSVVLIKLEFVANLQWQTTGNSCKERNHGKVGRQQGHRAPSQQGLLRNSERCMHLTVWIRNAVISVTSQRHSNVPALLDQCIRSKWKQRRPFGGSSLRLWCRISVRKRLYNVVKTTKHFKCTYQTHCDSNSKHHQPPHCFVLSGNLLVKEDFTSINIPN